MCQVEYGNRVFKYNLKRKNVKNINLTVKPNMEINVSANDNISIDEINSFIIKNGNWIERNLDYFYKTRPVDIPKKDYVSGETFRYLGRQYMLKVFENQDEYVKYYRGYIYIYVRDKNDRSRKKDLLDSWYDERRRIIFKEVLDKVYKNTKSLCEIFPSITIRKMNVRWGSCLIDQERIILNEDLIYAPKDCIEYVILHEMIHFRYKKHNKEFYNLMSLYMPGWQEKKKILDEYVVREI